MTAEQYLEHLRITCYYYEYFKKPFTLEESLKTKLEKAAGKKTTFSNEDLKNLPYARSNKIYMKFLDVCAKNRVTADIQPLLGYLPLRKLNAYATSAPNGEPIILIDMHLRMLFFCASIAVTEMIDMIQESKYDKAGMKDVILLLRSAYEDFFEPKINFSYEVKSIYRFISDMPAERTFFNSILSEAMELFILAHEYAHHFLGHVGSMSTLSINNLKTSVKLPIYNRSHEEEFEADNLGMQLFLSCADKASEIDLFQYLHLFQSAPELFFELLTSFESLYHRDINASIPNDTHPTASSRKEKLKKTYNLEYTAESLAFSEISDIVLREYVQWELQEGTGLSK